MPTAHSSSGLAFKLWPVDAGLCCAATEYLHHVSACPKHRIAASGLEAEQTIFPTVECLRQLWEG